jgi:hypothetical protein
VTALRKEEQSAERNRRTVPPPKEVSGGVGKESTNEGTGGKDGGDEGLLPGREGETTKGVVVVSEFLEPEGHLLDTRDVSGVCRRVGQ